MNNKFKITLKSKIIALCFFCAILLISVRSIQAQRAFTDHFTFFYTNDFENDPPSVENPIELPPIVVNVIGISAGNVNPTIPDYVIKLANWLEWAYGRYLIDGFRLPSSTNVKIGRPVQPAIVPDPNWIYFHRDEIASDEVPGTAAHELFHIVQLEYWNAYNLDFPFFIEGMTVAMENTVIPETARYQGFCEHANHRKIDNNQGLNWPHNFFDMGITDWEDAYYTGIIWTYLMEHNSNNTSPRYPGTDFILRFLEATDMEDAPGPPSEELLFDTLNDLLDDHGTNLDTEMKHLAFANLIRLYENFDGDHIYGFWWDDTDPSWFDSNNLEWTFSGIDVLPIFYEYRILNLNDESDAARLYDAYQGEYDHPDGVEDQVIIDEYGAAYWQYDNANLIDLINDAGGLAYDGPGLPYRVNVNMDYVSGSVPKYLCAVGFKDFDSIFHEAGLIRFDDDRIVRAGVAVTAFGYSEYDFGHTITAYEWTTTPSWGLLGALASEHTYRLPLAMHQILMRGITNAYDYYLGDTLSIIAYTTNTNVDVELSELAIPVPSFNYTYEPLFQMNLRKLSIDGFYLNHSEAIIYPQDRSDLTNYYIQNASGDSFYRLDLRQDPNDMADTGLLLTLFPYDINANPLPDLLIRDYSFDLDSSGHLTGKVAILNQGTADAYNARIPIFIEFYKWQSSIPYLSRRKENTIIEIDKESVIETVLYYDSRIDLAAGETEVIDIDYETNWDWQDEEEAHPGHKQLEVTVEMIVNSLKGSTGMEYLRIDELTTQNNGPERATVYCFYTPINTYIPDNIALGDLNQDGKITPKDAFISFMCYLGQGEYSGNYDINQDGIISPEDSLCIFKKYLKKPSCLDLLPGYN